MIPLMTEAETPWELLFCSSTDSALPAEVLINPYIIIHINVFWSPKQLRWLWILDAVFKAAFLNAGGVCFSSENNGRSTVPLQTKPEPALTYMWNIKGRCSVHTLPPFRSQQTPRHGPETLGKLHIESVFSPVSPLQLSRSPGSTLLWLTNPALIVGDLYRSRHRVWVQPVQSQEE